VKISEYERGHKDAIRKAVTWLHAEALRMNDPRAQRILNSAAHGLALACASEAGKAE
jgi:hypothetical protein